MEFILFVVSVLYGIWFGVRLGGIYFGVKSLNKTMEKLSEQSATQIKLLAAIANVETSRDESRQRVATRLEW